MEAILDGSWTPCTRILYGLVVYPFQPLTVGSATGQDQVALEIGDEVYTLELFRPDAAPSSSESSTWHRGFVCSGSKAAHSTESGDNEPMQVYFGIWPAVHVQIREELDQVPLQARQDPKQAAHSLSRSASARGGVVAMDPLQEEDEDVEETAASNGQPAHNGRLSKRISTQQPNKQRRLSLASIASATAPSFTLTLQDGPQNHQRSQSAASSTHSDTQTSRPPPPLPSLKCGDETAAGVREPLVDEVACALREWSQLLYVHLAKRQYDLFHQVKRDIDHLHVARRQLLSGALSKAEAAQVRQDIVHRLVRGNRLQDLDLIVRHPHHGSLVDIDKPGPSWASVIQLYSMQAKLAAVSARALGHERQPSRLGLHTAELFGAASHAENAIQSSAHIRDASISDGVGLSKAPGASAFYHLCLEVKALVATPGAPGELSELNFSIYNASERKFVSEDFCVVLNQQGSPVHLPIGGMRTLFKDLTAHDLADSLFLVCRIVRNGAIKSAPNGASTTSLLSPGGNGMSRNSSRNSYISTDDIDAVSPSGGVSMLRNLSNQGQTARRPFGCAVLDLSFLRNDSTPSSQQTHFTVSKEDLIMPIFLPNIETSFGDLHRDIISSNTSAFSSVLDKARMVSINLKMFHGIAADIVSGQPELLAKAPLAERLGFPDVVEPENQRNDLYVRLASGNFESAASAGASGTLRRGLRGIQHFANSSASAANIEVQVEVRDADGTVVRECISRGTGEPLVSTFSSMIIKGTITPVFNELLKLVLQPSALEACHLFFTFRARGSKDRSLASAGERPFAFAWLPLFPDKVTCLSDGTHQLALYRYTPEATMPVSYLPVPSIKSAADVAKRSSVLQSVSQLSLSSPSQLNLASANGAAASGRSSVTPQLLRDTFSIGSLACSTDFTQDENLLKLLRWQSSSSDVLSSEDISTMLSKLRYCSESELAKHIQPVLDALFAILGSKINSDGQLDASVFSNLVSIFAIVSDRRFHNFKLIVDRYLAERFQFTAYSHLLRGMQQLLSDRTESGEAPQALRAAIKVWPLLFHTIIRSRELQRAKAIGSEVTSDSIEKGFKRELKNLFEEINKMMLLTSPASIIGTQVLAMQHFTSIVESVKSIFTEDELHEIIINFSEASSSASGKLATHRLLLLARLCHGPLLNTASSRLTLIPDLIRWTRPFCDAPNAFELNAMIEGARDSVRIQWMESVRAATVVLAAMLHKMHLALVDPAVTGHVRAQTAEQDNIEYMLATLPRLTMLYDELKNPQLIETLARSPPQMSAASFSPAIFPTSYPFHLLTTEPSEDMPGKAVPSTLNLRGEVAAVVTGMLQLASPSVITNFFDASFEVEGAENFTKLLSGLCRFEKAVIQHGAYPQNWLNIGIVSHRVALKTVECAARLMQKHYIPSQESTYLFNFGLWRDVLDVLFSLLKSEQLVIEEFSPQKRRTVWRQAGDLRGIGSKVLRELWDSLGWPDQRIFSDRDINLGGYQVQLAPPFIESVLELCLSHHDELRTNAVHILFTVLIGESRLNSDLVAIQNQVIDTLDRLFSQRKGDEVSRGYFITQLQTLFESAVIDKALQAQMDRFLASVSHFLDLLLGIRNLPQGDEYLDDRIIGTLRLMSYIRDISSSQIFCKLRLLDTTMQTIGAQVRHYSRLKDYHVQCGNFTEAGLVLKLHADLYDYNTSDYVDAIEEHGLPRQSHFARKETLYLQILELLNRGKAWESALVICKELQERYEMVNFAYQRLSEILLHQSTLYANIVREPRLYPNSFRVSYYGRGFPKTVQNRQFVYRGNIGEKFGAFRERHMNKHPAAVLLDAQGIPDEEIQNAEGQFMQICQVTPEPDRSFPIFTNTDVPACVRGYYEHNGTNIFVYETKVMQDNGAHGRSNSVPVDFLATWTLKTILVCADAFPTVLKRTEVVDTRYQEVSPLERAVQNVERSTSDLQSLDRKYTALQQDGTSRLNANPLSMALNAVVDPGQNAGVPLYRRAFFAHEFVVSYPDKAELISQLRTNIDQLTLTISRALRLHGQICAPDMMSFHETLQSFFYKNFAHEISSLALDDPSPALPDSWANGIGRPESVTSGNGSSMQGSSEPPYLLPTLAASPPKKPPKNKGRYSVSLVPQTFGDVPASPATANGITPSSSAGDTTLNIRSTSPDLRDDTTSVLSSGEQSTLSPKIRRTGSLLRFGSITARRNGSKKSLNGVQ